MLDIVKIRDALNELAFEEGTRRVAIGRLSELLPDGSEPATSRELAAMEEQLRRYGLALARDAADPDLLYAEQTLRQTPIDLRWLSVGIEWVAKITTVALEMALPAVLGFWLDRQLGTRFLGIVGAALGITLGLWHLIKMTQSAAR